MLEKQTRTKKKVWKKRYDRDLCKVDRSTGDNKYVRAFQKRHMFTRDYDLLDSKDPHRQRLGIWPEDYREYAWYRIGKAICRSYIGLSLNEAHSDLCEKLGKSDRANCIRDWGGFNFFGTFVHDETYQRSAWNARFDASGWDRPFELNGNYFKNRNTQPLWNQMNGFIFPRKGIAYRGKEGRYVYKYDEESRTWIRWVCPTKKAFTDDQPASVLGPFFSRIEPHGSVSHRSSSVRVLRVFLQSPKEIFATKLLGRNLKEEYEKFVSMSSTQIINAKSELYSFLKHHGLNWDHNDIFKQIESHSTQRLPHFGIWAALLSLSYCRSSFNHSGFWFFNPSEPETISNSMARQFRLPKHDHAVILNSRQTSSVYNYFQKDSENEQEFSY